MKCMTLFIVLFVAGCATTTNVTTITEETVSVRVPPVIERLPGETQKDSLTIVTHESPVATVTVRPEVKDKTPERIQKVKEALAEVGKWDVQLNVQPPPVDHKDRDTVKTTIRENGMWDNIRDIIPLALVLVLGLIILYIVRGK